MTFLVAMLCIALTAGALYHVAVKSRLEGDLQMEALKANAAELNAKNISDKLGDYRTHALALDADVASLKQELDSSRLRYERLAADFAGLQLEKEALEATVERMNETLSRYRRQLIEDSSAKPGRDPSSTDSAAASSAGTLPKDDFQRRKGDNADISTRVLSISPDNRVVAIDMGKQQGLQEGAILRLLGKAEERYRFTVTQLEEFYSIGTIDSSNGGPKNLARGEILLIEDLPSKP